MIDYKKNIEPLDLSYLKSMSGGKADFIIKMLDAFKIQTPINMADLESAIVAKNWKATYEFAHKIKPTFFYVGRADARDLMQEIEHNARELNTATITAAFIEAKEFVTILYKQLDEAIALLT